MLIALPGLWYSSFFLPIVVSSVVKNIVRLHNCAQSHTPWCKTLTNLTFLAESKEWKLYPQLIGEPVGEPQQVDEIEGSTAQYPLYTITAHVKRIHSFYMWNHVLYMVCVMSSGLGIS